MATKLQYSPAQLAEVAQHHKLELVILHGSHAAGQTHDNSDLDLALLPLKGTQPHILELYSSMADVFPQYRVDLANLATANPLLLHSVMSRGILLYGDKTRFHELELQAFHAYNDYRPYFQLEHEFIQERLNSYVTA